MRSLCLSHSTPLPPCSPSSCLICTTWRGVKIRTVSMWSGGLWGAWSVSGWATVDPHFLAWETGETFMTCIWEGGFMVEWHDMTAECRVPRGAGHGGGGGVLPTFACWLHTDKHTKRHTESASKVMAWVHSVLLYAFVLFHLQHWLLLLLFALVFFVPFWSRIRKSFESPLSSAVWMHSWMLFGGAFAFFFNFAFANIIFV